MNNLAPLGPDLLAVPPMALPFHAGTGAAFAAIYGAALLGFALWAWRAGHGLTVTAMLLGGMCTSVIEPILDVTSGAYHPNLGQPRLFTLMGRGMPLWLVLCYGLYYGGLGALTLLALRRGISRRSVWLWFLVPLVGDVVLEQVMLSQHLYYYYGNQPLVMLGFPLYQPAGNSVGELLATATLFFVQPLLSRKWFIFPLAITVMPLAGAMGFNAVAFPTDYAVHSTWPNLAVQGCAVATWLLAAIIVHGIAQLVGTDSRLRATGRLVL